ncbi:MAG: monovalent cation/H+ antiporter subunit D [Brachymonas sp.]|nr:monovalent cation/H+ antiporter subunit D [Brachymonas sp.]MDO4795224.1 monovalent cation/H+ antiporter subunit D [Brachymonas sp.]
MIDWIAPLMPHVLIVPVLLPMLMAAGMLLLGERAVAIKGLLGMLACLLNLAVAVALVLWVRKGSGSAAVAVYLPGNWATPFGIALAVDRLSAMMLLVTAIVGLAALLFSRAGWDRAGVHFHSLLQLQLMGINGAFLTTDLFNLFVFFEIMLTASYGLLLHGTGWSRVRSALHYIAINLLASAMFLLGMAVLFGVTGTLSMADMAEKITLVPAHDRGLLHAGAALLAMAFLGKAAIWPLNFWLPPAYSAASPPVAALFTVMTKVGLYAVLRLWTLLFPASATGSELFGNGVLIWGGLLTLLLASIGMLASQNLGRLAGFSVLASSGTLLAAFGFGQAHLTGGALYYLISSTLALCALFLVTDLIARSRQEEEKVPLMPFGKEAQLFFHEPGLPAADAETNLDDSERPLFGQPIAAALAVLGLAFTACALLVAGLPPLSGFVGKVTMMTALLNPGGLGASSYMPRFSAWVLLALFILSGLFATIAYSRAGIRFFWAPRGRPAPHLKVIEVLPIGLLLALCLLLTVRAGPVLRYTERTAFLLHTPHAYVDAVMKAPVKPGPTDPPAQPPAPAPAPYPQPGPLPASQTAAPGERP